MSTVGRARRFEWRWIGGLACCLALAAIVFVFSATKSANAEWRELIAAVAKAPARPLEGRLSGGFAYAPPPPVRRGAADRSLSPEITIATARIEKSVRDNTSNPPASALGASYLIQGRIDEGVSILEAVVDRDPSNADFQNDLAAAYLARALSGEQPEDWPRALTAAERARRHRPGMPEASFNAAVALEALHLDEEAIGAWTEYVRLEPIAAWKAEGQARLSALIAVRPGSREDVIDAIGTALDRGDRARLAELARTEAAVVRGFLEDRVLVEWAQLSAAGAPGPERDRSLNRADLLVEALDHLYPERYFRDLVADARAANGAARVALAQGYLAHERARRAYEALRLDDLDVALRAVRSSVSGHSTLGQSATLYGAIASYYRRDFDACRAALTTLLADTPATHLRIVAQSHLMFGLIAINQARFEQSLAELDAAQSAFSRGGDVEGSVNTMVTRAETLRLLGQEHEAWMAYYDGLRRLRQVRDPKRLQAVFYVGDLATERSGLIEASIHFSEMSLRAARQSANATGVSEAELRLANGYARLRDDAATWRVLRQARADNTAADAATASLNAARIAEIEAAVLVRSEPAKAVKLLSDSIGHYEATDRAVSIPPALLERAKAHAALGDVDAAERDLRTSLDVVSRESRLISNDLQRTALADSVWPTVEEFVRVQWHIRGRPEDAFVVAENAKSGVAGAAHAGTWTVPSLQRALPPASALVYYFVQPTELLVWVVTPDGVYDERRPITREQLQRAVSRFRSDLQRPPGPGMASRSSDDVSALLLDVVDAHAGEARRLYVVLDDVLQDVPFAALRDRRSHRYLIEDHEIVHLTCARDLLSPPALTPAPRRVLSIAPAATADASGLRLPILRFATEEATTIAGEYSTAQLLTGADATVAAFTRLIDQVDVVHFAGHTVVNRQTPSLTRLLFAPGEAGQPGAIFSSDIAKLPALHALVVLASCESGAGAISRSEGSFSAARRFLDRGSSGVVSALWPLDDGQSMRFFIQLHQRIVSGLAPGDALRQTQLEAINGRDGSAPNQVWQSMRFLTTRPLVDTAIQTRGKKVS